MDGPRRKTVFPVPLRVGMIVLLTGLLAAVTRPNAAAPVPLPSSGNLLRNARFQDDWGTLLPQNKTLHWCYSTDAWNRRDYNPDGWQCRGNWDWADADQPAGSRRLVLAGPSARVAQRVNWAAIHDDRKTEGFPDAGGFPVLRALRNPHPERLVRSLTFRLRLKGTAVPENAGTASVQLSPLGRAIGEDPYGEAVLPLASASTPLPAGTYPSRWIEVTLSAEQWLNAARNLTAAPKDTAEAEGKGVLLPGTAGVEIHYTGATGQVELEEARLAAGPSEGVNLIGNGGFEALDGSGYPSGWSRAEKYAYFPPGLYYLFTTWHNGDFENRGNAASDHLVLHSGAHSLRMIVPSGDEQAVTSAPIRLDQKEARLLEFSAWVKTDRLVTLQLDAVDEQGRRVDGFDFIHKAPLSIGTDEWREVRQLFRPRAPLQSVRLRLCARGMNGYTLGDTAAQPQNNACGTVWWDDLRLTEPESSVDELTARGVRPASTPPITPAPHLAELDPGERLLGPNELHAVVENPGAAGRFRLEWSFTSPTGKRSGTYAAAVEVPAGGRAAVRVPYMLTESTSPAYTEYHGELVLREESGRELARSELWFTTWTQPLVVRLGALYLRPDEKQLVRMNFGLSAARMEKLVRVRLELLRRGTGQSLFRTEVPASPADFATQRARIPSELRDDFRGLLLADLDVSALPLHLFAGPARDGIVRVTGLDAQGQPLATAESEPFGRLAHDPPQPSVLSSRIGKNGFVTVNNEPWMPWGATYGHVPVYDGPAAPAGKPRDLRNLQSAGIYDQFGDATYTRAQNDFNCSRYVAGSVTPLDAVAKTWIKDNRYASSVFVSPEAAFGVESLVKAFPSRQALDAYLTACRESPAVVSLAPGIEEAFGLFHSASAEQVAGLKAVVEQLRQATGKPVMVGHGGYWNRLEFEKAPFFDIYDPETEPWYPANLHTDLQPLVAVKASAIWLRPQMYEDVPFERWRFHALVEFMRGARGWQFAHGPGDPTLFRGLHGELEHLKPVAFSGDPAPGVQLSPSIEHWARRLGGKTFVIAATTHGIPLGSWHWSTVQHAAGSQRSRVTTAGQDWPGDGGPAGGHPERALAIHGVQYLPDARKWPAGTRLVQWLRLDPQQPPRNLVVLVKGDGRWTHSASWGAWDPATLRKDPILAYRFLHAFYRHASGFLGFDASLLAKALPNVPSESFGSGPLPAAGEWVRLEVPLDRIGLTGKLLDGVGFLHDGGRVFWGPTTLIAPDGTQSALLGDRIGSDPAQLEHTRIVVPGLKAGATVRVLFEDREIRAEAGSFTDNFRGQDLYQRYGGRTGYGDTPVAVHVYEIPMP